VDKKSRFQKKYGRKPRISEEPEQKLIPHGLSRACQLGETSKKMIKNAEIIIQKTGNHGHDTFQKLFVVFAISARCEEN
jgi:hypothetical protein